MKSNYTKQFNISYSNIDLTGRLGLVESVNLNQDMITEYFGAIGSDNKVLREKYNAAWIYTQTKIRIAESPFWNTSVVAEAFTSAKSPIRTDVETKICGADGKLLVCAKTQMCVIDFAARKLCKLDDVDYPVDMELGESALPEKFSKLNADFGEGDFVYEQKVFASDTDFTQHTNNSRYVKYLMNTFDVDFYTNKAVTDFEIRFEKESRAGDTLRIYKKQIADGEYAFAIKSGEEVVVAALMKYAERVNC